MQNPTYEVKNVTNWQDVPGSNNYFTTSDVRPTFDGQTLKVYNAFGERRKWGTPRVKSRIEKLADDLVMVDVVGWHKYTISPVGGSYYFVFNPCTGTWDRRTANHRYVKQVLGEGGSM